MGYFKIIDKFEEGNPKILKLWNWFIFAGFIGCDFIQR